MLFFVYVKVFKNNSRISLSNNYSWSKFFFNNFSKYTNGEIFNFFDDKRIYFQLWKLLDEGSNQLIVDTGKEFDIGNGIDIILPNQEFTEFFVFATNKSDQAINNFYLNNFDVLTQAIFYFKDKARNIIKEAEKNGIIEYTGTVLPGKSLINKQEILKQIEPKRYYLPHDVYLTPMEYSCVSLLADLKSIKEISNSLNLSEKTVETYFDRVKNKVKYYRKSDLINIAKYLNLRN